MMRMQELQKIILAEEQQAAKIERERDEKQRKLAACRLQLELAKAQSGKGTEEAEAKVKCNKGHMLKPKRRLGEVSIVCDICRGDRINSEFNFFFSCDFTCDFDMCPCCYNLALTKDVPKHNSLFQQFKQQGEIKQRRQMQARLGGGGSSDMNDLFAAILLNRMAGNM